MIRVKFHTREIRALQTALRRFVETRALAIAGSIVAREIKRKTAQGIDAYGRPFKPYSKRHAARRKKLGLQTRRVDLKMNLTGPPSLLASIKMYYGDTVKGGIVTVDDLHAAIAQGLTAQGRTFLDITPDIAYKIEGELWGHVKRLGGGNG